MSDPDAVGPDVVGTDDLVAGGFSAWVDEMQGALCGERGSDVPCDGCTACCTSSQFVHIGPDESDTLSRIPSELLFPAPGLPAGHVVLGYDHRGHCPMLVDNRCSIYEDRPRTCRTYDCRVFPATGVAVGGDDHDKPQIAARAQRWRFAFPAEADRTRRDAVRAATRFLVDDRNRLPDRVAPRNPTQLAVLAIEIHAAFLDGDPDPAVVVDQIVNRTAARPGGGRLE